MKKQLREDIKQILKRKSKVDQKDGEAIVERLKILMADMSCQRVACFVGVWPEICTDCIIRWLFSMNHQVFIPTWKRIEKKMWMIPLGSVEEYEYLLQVPKEEYYEKYGHHIPMPPPPSDDALIHYEIDICLTPGLAFSANSENPKREDWNGKYHRLGYGFGLYDRYFSEYLAQHQKLPLRIGLGYDEQIINNSIWPKEEHDILLDILITPSNQHL